MSLSVMSIFVSVSSSHDTLVSCILQLHSFCIDPRFWRRGRSSQLKPPKAKTFSWKLRVKQHEDKTVAHKFYPNCIVPIPARKQNILISNSACGMPRTPRKSWYFFVLKCGLFVKFSKCTVNVFITGNICQDCPGFLEESNMNCLMIDCKVIRI